MWAVVKIINEQSGKRIRCLTPPDLEIGHDTEPIPSVLTTYFPTHLLMLSSLGVLSGCLKKGSFEKIMYAFFAYPIPTMWKTDVPYCKIFHSK
jgi:hypothetical protein